MSAIGRLRAWGLRLVAAFGGGRQDRDLQEELESHLAMIADEERRAGLPPGEAERTAAARFGSIAAVTDACRDRRGLPSLEHWLRDCRYAVRSLRRTPLLALSMIALLGLGIGAGTAILMVLHGIVWRSLPVPDADRVVKLTLGLHGDYSRTVLGHPSRFSYPEIAEYRQSARALQSIAAFRDEQVVWRRDGDARPLHAMLVTSDYFRCLPVGLTVGRLLGPSDAHQPTVVLSERLWRDALAADPAVVGTTMMIDRRPHTVIGVAAAPFTGTEFTPAQVWLPLEATMQGRAKAELLNEPNTGWLMAVGRLAPNESIVSARAEAAVVAAHLDASYPGRRATIDVARAAAADAGLFASSDRVQLLGGGVAVAVVIGILLFICGSNVAGLLLTRGATRQHELAVRIALGAGRGRILQQLLGEIAVITGAGAALGVLVCWWSLRLLALAPPFATLVETIPLDWRLLAMTVASAAAIAVLFGIAPARQALQVDCLDGLRGNAAMLGTRVPAARLRGWLVAAQVAVSVVLLVAGALMSRSAERTFALNPGFATAGLFVVQPDLATGPGDLAAPAELLVHELTQQLLATPGIRDVARAMTAPYYGIGIINAASAGMPSPVPVHFNAVDGAYLRTLGVRVIAGRPFQDREENVAVVNAALARAFWKEERAAVGQTMTIPGARPGDPTHVVQVVGVIPTLQTENPGLPDGPTCYEPVPAVQHASGLLLVRADAGVEVPRLAAAVARAVDRDAFVQARSLDELVGLRASVARAGGLAAWLIGAVALLVAAVGIHGIVAHAVVCRTRDIGLHLALGASPTQVLRLVLRQTMTGALYGALAGGLVVTVAALSFSAEFRKALFGLNPLDPVSVTLVVLTLAAATLSAAWLPARRAMRISPIEALKRE